MTTKTKITISLIVIIIAVLFFATKNIFFKPNSTSNNTDINSDGITNSVDLELLKAQFNKECHFWQSCPTDINHDGITDVADFNLLVNNYGKKNK